MPYVSIQIPYVNIKMTYVNMKMPYVNINIPYINITSNSALRQHENKKALRRHTNVQRQHEKSKCPTST